MRPEKIRRLIGENVDELFETGKQIEGNFDKDVIHDFRVEVKTLRSFLRLINTETNIPVELPKKLKRLYHIAGAIRDTQLEMERLSAKEQQLPNYTANLRYSLERQKNEWSRHYSKKTFRRLSYKLLETDYKRLPPTALPDFFNLRMLWVADLGKVTSPTDNQVHSIRKHIKDVLYCFKIAKKHWKKAYSLVSDIPLEPLDNTADEIGEYNDRRIMLEHLGSFSSRSTEQDEADNIIAICHEDRIQLNHAKKTIMEKVNTLPGVLQ